MQKVTIQKSESVNVLKQRDYLTESEVNQLIDAIKKISRNPLRDSLLIYMSYRHGLRVSEAINLNWSAIDFERASIYVYRLKRGQSSTHPLNGLELRQLKQLKQTSKSEYIFVSERGTPLSTSTVRMMYSKLRLALKIKAPIHAHALRHACGHKLADKGIDTRRIQDYLGHTAISSTARYTQLSANKFRDFNTII